MLYMVTFTINIPPMLAYIPAPWILWVRTKSPEPDTGPSLEQSQWNSSGLIVDYHD